MNFRIIVYIIGHIIKIEGLLLSVPLLAGLVYGEYRLCGIYAAVGLALYVVGTAMTISRPTNNIFYLKEGCVATALCWIILSLTGALPLIISGETTSFTDAVFEITSGFTTTGSSILSDVESLSHASLVWRSFTHWIGGMGVLIFMLAVIPLTGGSNINLMKAESPGPQVDKSLPKVKNTASLLYAIYLALSALELIILIITRMPIFDAICITFGTAGTGGFGILNSSCGDYSTLSQGVITIFMLLFGINFNVYVYIVFRRFKKAFLGEEIRVYLGIVLASIIIITINTYDAAVGLLTTLSRSSFQVASIVTTTGYSTCDFDGWPTLSKAILVLLMFIGACAGSTAGGIKVSRIHIAFKSFIREINSFLRPKEVKTIRMDGKVVDPKTLSSVTIYFISYSIVFIVSLLLISLDGHDLITTFTAVAATLNNIGPGLSLVGPSANFSFLSTWCKWVLIFDMLAGRLEIFPMLMLMHPAVWRGTIIKHRRSY